MDPLHLLKEQGKIDDQLLTKAEELVATGEESYESALIKSGLDPSEVKKFFAEYFQVPAFSIPEGFSVSQEILAYVPQDSAVHYRIIPLGVEDGILLVGASNPDDLQMRDALNFIANKNIDKNKKIFIKIDLEGYDFNAIYGSKNLINNYFTIILFEFSKIAVKNEIYSKKSFDKFLIENELSIFDINGNKQTLETLHEKLNSLKKNHNVCGNFLILKNENITSLKFWYLINIYSIILFDNDSLIIEPYLFKTSFIILLLLSVDIL